MARKQLSELQFGGTIAAGAFVVVEVDFDELLDLTLDDEKDVVELLDLVVDAGPMELKMEVG